ncbi:MAG TPA: ribosomal protein S18-alanine N-acetyltransferase [Chloroflexota bacterium]|nr:ribosomal protein S18-alanine N-acetyltransferase [Chloroflexota bacterium]
MAIRVERMTMRDVPEVMAIERESFSAPWPVDAYRRELIENRMAHYFLLRLFPAIQPEVEEPEPEEAMPARRGFLGLLVPRLWRPQVPPAPRTISIAGYAGLWLMVDEAHITTIGVRPRFRRRGYGELLLVTLIEAALDINARWLTLEVRVSNDLAQQLYRKYGFHDAGIRRRYYTDNHEDALIMWTDELHSAAFQDNYRRLKERLLDRLEQEGLVLAGWPAARRIT